MTVWLRADRIRQILAKKNMSQNALATYAKTGSAYMSQLMTGRRTPSPEMRERIMKVLGVKQFDRIFTLECTYSRKKRRQFLGLN